MSTSEHTDDEEPSDERTPEQAMRDAGETDEAPDDALATVEDFTHTRDGDGELLPVREPLPGGEKEVEVIPMRQGDANEYLPASGDPRELDDDELLELLAEFYVTPDFSGVESLDDVLAFGLDPLLMALMNASGFDMAADMLADSNELVEAVQGNSSRGN